MQKTLVHVDIYVIVEAERRNIMMKTRNLEGAEYWEAYRRHKCTGRPIISVEVGKVKSKWLGPPVKKTKWVRKSGSGEWVEVEV